MNRQILLGSTYLGPVEYYAKIYAYSNVFIEGFDHYMKQTYRNRCTIASANGPLSLTIPVEKGPADKVLMKDVRISDHGNWRHNHWNSFVASYKQSPFFDYYSDEFHTFFEKKYDFLYDFNMELCQWVCAQVDLGAQLVPTADYIAEPSDMDDYRNAIHPKKNVADHDAHFYAKPYYQVFDQKQGFTPNLSIADLLFNMGPEALIVLRDCNK